MRLLSEAAPDFALHRQAYLSRKAGKWPMMAVNYTAMAVNYTAVMA